MTREEKIKEAYEAFGMDWLQISHLVSIETGVLIMPTPDLKTSLTGYENLVADKNKFIAFGSEGLKMQPSSLKGLYNNRCWVKIESEDDLPTIPDFYWVIEEKGEINIVHWEDLNQQGYTHYQSITKPQPPLF